MSLHSENSGVLLYIALLQTAELVLSSPVLSLGVSVAWYTCFAITLLVAGFISLDDI
jgi:hypothetical protein